MAQEWHHEVSTSIDDRMIESVRHTSWEPLIEEFEAGALLVRPVTNGADLASLAREMKNCLLTYLNRCACKEIQILALYRHPEYPEKQLSLFGASELR